MNKNHKFTLYLSAIILALLVVLGLFLFRSYQKQKLVNQYFPLPKQTTQQEPEKIELPADSIPKMSERDYLGSNLKLVEVLTKNETYTRYSITYKSEGFTISGIMNVPNGEGPFPILILNHGYIEPENYTNGQGLKREQDFFARHGYVVLHSDYRNYGYSDYDPGNDVRPRSGYVEDVLNAAAAIKNSEFSFLDKDNIGMLGHSMGGGIALNVMVTKPDTAKAYALLAPINSDYKVNFDTWVKDGWPEAAQQFYNLYGTYEQNPLVWESFSAKNYFDRINAPIVLHQGTVDDQVPVQWSRDLNENLRKAGKQITYYEYPGEPHTFIAAQDLVMQRTLEFFDKNLKNK